ncbi:AraC-like DNA-binding protein [Metabacillus crassostreae]|uniref:AraC family transcriptional regulator n=1 Tax=Metabacillus crassostreae TaxID=929098 RepID=UPI0019588579|nr:AraC family transcriptional regulator [Metabacillus crassostreae]MBM7603851.1 AraC-like DNA-binding protein [Metabacillus crassostreae]
MNSIKLNSYSLPLIRDIGYIHDSIGIFRHPDRKMKKINVFIYVVEGSIHVIEEGSEYRINKGSYLFLRKNKSHWGGDLYKPGTKWFYIHFYDSPPSESLIEEVEYKYYPQSSLINEDTYHTSLSLPKHGTVTNDNYTESKLKNLVALYDNPHPLRPLQLSVQTYQFFIDLFSNHIEDQQESKNNYIVNQMIKILRTSENKLTGEAVATSLGMNYAYLSTIFKKQTGRSVNVYQNELLIEKAIEMFKKNEGNVSEVSDALGFSNPFYFSRVFKRITGVAPTTYINENYRYQ